MNWMNLWNTLPGTQEICGLNSGFWIALGVVADIVIIENVVFWGMKPKMK